MRQLFGLPVVALSALLFLQPARAQVFISVGFGPPALPVYEQPPCPQDAYLWAPGYWAWDPDNYDYYWVPGTWVLAPQPGYLWTPPWWGWDRGAYYFHPGYWATEVGFYGGIYYGFGYFGRGFEGGRWDHDRFFYNRSVTNINIVNIHNVYNTNTTVVNNVTVNRVSYNGGEGGIQVRPTPQEDAVQRLRHLPPVAVQTQHVEMARSDVQLRASANQGRPPVAATVHPTEFRGHDVVTAKEVGAPYHPPANRPSLAGASTSPDQHAAPPHARDLIPHQPSAAQGNAPADLRNQEQQQKLVDRENQEHLKLEQQQEKEHQQAAKEHWDQQRVQQMEQSHQQQTQQLVERHAEEQHRPEPRQNPPRPH
jgi:hypothetical protein